jgi:hypothetical protein
MSKQATRTQEYELGAIIFGLSFCSMDLAGRMRQTDARSLFPEPVSQNRHLSRNTDGPRPRPEVVIDVGDFRFRSALRHRLSTLERRLVGSGRRRSTEKDVSFGGPRKRAQTLWMGSSRR